MSVPPDQMPDPIDTQSAQPELPRFDIPEVDTSITTPEASAGAVKSTVDTIAPPQDINAAQIGEYTPYTETLGTVDEQSTVEGRLGGLLSQNNPYIDRARTEAAQLANRRGMLNTAMAAGSAEGAAIDRALPIAQQDARAHLEQQFLNQGYSNDAAKHLADQSVTRQNLQAGFEQDTSQFNAARNFEASKLQFEAENRANQQYANEQNKNNFATVSADLQAQLKGLDNELAKGLETLTREYGLLENLDSINGDIYKQMIAEMGTILANEDKAGTATAKINALIKSAGVELNFSNSMTGGSTGGVTGGSGGPSSISEGDIKPPKPGKNYIWDDKSWSWKKKTSTTSGPDHTCFTGDTLVTMADGSEKQIADVKIGEILLGMDGEENVVLEFDRPTVGGRDIFSFNDGKPFVTHEHPFMTSNGWKSLSPHATKAENSEVEATLLVVGDYLEAIGNPLIELKKIEKHTFDPETPLYNFKLTGNHTYYANGYLVHNKGPGGVGDSGGTGAGAATGGGGSGVDGR